MGGGGVQRKSYGFFGLNFAPFYHPLTSTLEYPMGIKDMGGGGGFSIIGTML